jgi:hypothetical protein
MLMVNILDMASDALLFCPLSTTPIVRAHHCLTQEHIESINE